MARVKLTPAFVTSATAEPGAERTIYWDTSLTGFGLMVTANGHRSYVIQYRKAGRSRRMAIKDVLSLKDAKNEAKRLLGTAAKEGEDPLENRRAEKRAATDTLKAIAERYFSREGKNIRTMDDRKAAFQRLIFPRLGKREIGTIRRSDVVKLLDKIEDENGSVMADKALAFLRRLFSWHASRDDKFNSPIVRGMARTKPRERARRRVLADEEICAIWKASRAGEDPFRYLVRFLLLTATRRNESARMLRSELAGAEWTIPSSRHKSSRDFLLPLSKAAQTLLADIPVIGRKNAGPVFTTDGDNPISGFSKFKKGFDKSCGVPGWTLHDLRRTARSLMSRAGVDADIAERCLGHVIGGVRGIYDRYEYRDEKAQGFEALAALIEHIVDPQPNVIPLRDAGASPSNSIGSPNSTTTATTLGGPPDQEMERSIPERPL